MPPLATTQAKTHERVGLLEQEVRALGLRTAWAEKDTVFARSQK